MADIDTLVRTAIADALRIGIDRVTDEAKIYEDLEADSLDLIEILLTIEERLDVQVPDQTLEGLTSVGDLITRVRKVIQ